MCIIVIGNQANRQHVTPELIHNCWDYNSNGAGIMWVQNKRTQLIKGLMTEADFTEAFKKVPARSVFALHFRIATSGGVNPQMTHPFPFEYAGETAAVMHNGVMAWGSREEQKSMSDTALWVKDILAPAAKAGSRKLLDNIIGFAATNTSSRYALAIGGSIYYYGDFTEDKELGGLLFSNTTYKTKATKYGYSCANYDGFEDVDWRTWKKDKDTWNNEDKTALANRFADKSCLTSNQLAICEECGCDFIIPFGANDDEKNICAACLMYEARHFFRE